MMEEGERGWRRERGDGGGRDGMEEGERNTGGREEARGWKKFCAISFAKNDLIVPL